MDKTLEEIAKEYGMTLNKNGSHYILKTLDGSYTYTISIAKNVFRLQFKTYCYNKEIKSETKTWYGNSYEWLVSCAVEYFSFLGFKKVA